MVLVKRPFIGTEVIDEGNGIRVVNAVISKQVARLGPVFLFNVSIIVLFVRP